MSTAASEERHELVEGALAPNLLEQGSLLPEGAAPDGAAPAGAAPAETGSGSPAGWGEQRQPPFYCPYCAEEDLVPHVPAPAVAADVPTGREAAAGRPTDTAPTVAPGAWLCKSCLRVFSVRFHGVGVWA